MIIKATFRDNDFTYILDNFFVEGVMFYTHYIRYRLSLYKSKEDARKYVELNTQIEDLIRKFVFENDANITKEDRKQFLEILKEALDCYMYFEYTEDYDYLKKRLKLSFVQTVKDEDMNGEVIYYFLKHKRRLDM